jgi:hypothetical protein
VLLTVDQRVGCEAYYAERCGAVRAVQMKRNNRRRGGGAGRGGSVDPVGQRRLGRMKRGRCSHTSRLVTIVGADTRRRKETGRTEGCGESGVVVGW